MKESISTYKVEQAGNNTDFLSIKQKQQITHYNK